MDSASPDGAMRPPEGDRALRLLDALRRHQSGLCRPAALAWERAAFAEAFDDPAPGARIRRFLEQG